MAGSNQFVRLERAGVHTATAHAYAAGVAVRHLVQHEFEVVETLSHLLNKAFIDRTPQTNIPKNVRM